MSLALVAVVSSAAVVATFLPWLTVDASGSAEFAPDFVPDRLVDVGSTYRISAHTMLGLGTFLAFLVVVGGGLVALGAHRGSRWPFVLAAATYLVAGGIASASILVLRIASFGYRWVLPDDWVGDSPSISLGAAGVGFVVACVVAAAFATRLMFGQGARATPRAARSRR